MKPISITLYYYLKQKTVLSPSWLLECLLIQFTFYTEIPLFLSPFLFLFYLLFLPIHAHTVPPSSCPSSCTIQAWRDLSCSLVKSTIFVWNSCISTIKPSYHSRSVFFDKKNSPACNSSRLLAVPTCMCWIRILEKVKIK